MRIAVITGASSGLGREFVKRMDEKHELDEIWVIARRKDRLEELAQRADIRAKVRPIALDLTDINSIEEYKKMLEAEKPVVAVLVNAGGFGKFREACEVPLEEQYGMIDLNVRALTGMTHVTIPFMTSGTEVYQIGSLSSFQPVPYIAVYGATKAFVLSYSRALNSELKKKGVKMMAVCPGWVKTEFFDRAVTDDTITYYNKYFTSEQVVDRAIRDMDKNKDVSVCGFSVRAQVLAVKILPHKLVMWIWKKQQKKD